MYRNPCLLQMHVTSPGVSVRRRSIAYSTTGLIHFFARFQDAVTGADRPGFGEGRADRTILFFGKTDGLFNIFGLQALAPQQILYLKLGIDFWVNIRALVAAHFYFKTCGQL